MLHRISENDARCANSPHTNVHPQTEINQILILISRVARCPAGVGEVMDGVEKLKRMEEVADLNSSTIFSFVFLNLTSIVFVTRNSMSRAYCMLC